MDFRYIAGFFDAEGSVSSFRYNRKKREKAGYCPHLSMAQSDPRILHEVRDFLGYGVIWRNQLTIRGKQNVIHFADHVGPHLRVKKKRVMLAREMAVLVGEDNQPRSEESLRRRKELALQIQAITASGRRYRGSDQSK